MNSSIYTWMLGLVNRCKTAARSVRAFLKSGASSLFSNTSAVRKEDAEQFAMPKVIWMVWFTGWNNAPWLVKKCLASWQFHNPDWEIRPLDANSLRRYIELPELEGKEIIPAHMADILRVMLLHEYGGVWCDSTLLCHRPLNSWLPDAMSEGFFAFARPSPDRVVSAWFFATKAGHLLMERFHAAVLRFWKDNDRAVEYFWPHSLFGKLCESDPQFLSAWNRVPKISADGPHGPQFFTGLLEENESAIEKALLSLAPVSKLTHRIDETAVTEKTLLSRLLADLPEPVLPAVRKDGDAPGITQPKAALHVGSRNLGDYIQRLASQRLIERTFTPPEFFIDLDDEIQSAPGLDLALGPSCLMLTFPRRDYSPAQKEVFVVSRDQEILSILPPSLSDASYLCHCVSGSDFEENIQAAAERLETYKTRARLIVTTELDCALPAIAMDIPVVVFYPKNNESGEALERERFTGLASLIPIHRFEDVAQVDWAPKPVSVAEEKLRIVDSVYQIAERWQLPMNNRFPRLAPTSTLPPPSVPPSAITDYSFVPDSPATT